MWSCRLDRDLAFSIERFYSLDIFPHVKSIDFLLRSALGFGGLVVLVDLQLTRAKNAPGRANAHAVSVIIIKAFG